VSNITLRRAVAEQTRDELYSLVREADSDCDYLNCKECEPIRPIWDAIVVFDAALAEPEQKPEPVAWMYVNSEGECEQIEYGTPSIDDDSITLLYAVPPADAKRKPATVEQIDEEYIRPVIDARWHDFEAGFRAAEKFHGITKEDGK
jgi:hypothetical protein